MACDYERIRRDNERRYGTDIGRIGRMLLASIHRWFVGRVGVNAVKCLSDLGK